MGARRNSLKLSSLDSILNVSSNKSWFLKRFGGTKSNRIKYFEKRKNLEYKEIKRIKKLKRDK